MRPIQLCRIMLALVLLTACQAANPTATPPSQSSPTPKPQALAERATAAPTNRPIQTLVATSTVVPPSPAPNPPTTIPTLPPQASAPGVFFDPTATPNFPEQHITADALTNLQPLRTVGLGGASATTVSPDGSLLVVATSAGLSWYTLPEMRHLRFDSIEGGVSGSGLQFSPDGRHIIIGRTIETVEVRSVFDGSVSVAVEGTNPRLSPDGAIIATQPIGLLPYELSQEIILWELATGRKITTVPGSYPAGPSTMAGTSPFSHDSQLIATEITTKIEPPPTHYPMYKYSTSVWRVVDGTLVRDFPNHHRPAFSPDGRWIATTDESTVALWNLDGSGNYRFLPPGPKGGVRALAFDHQNTLLVVSVQDNRLLAWDPSTEQFTERFANMPEVSNLGYCQHVEFNLDASILIIRETSDCTFVPTGIELIRTSDGHRLYQGEHTVSVSLNHTNTHIVTQDQLMLESIVNLEQQTTISLEALLPETTAIKSLAFSPDGQTLATGGSLLTLWDAVDGSPQDIEITSAAAPYLMGFSKSRLRYSPNGQAIVFDGFQLVFEGCAPVGTAWQLQGNQIGETLWEEYAWCDWMSPKGLWWAFNPNSGASVSVNTGMLLPEHMRGITLTLSTPITPTAAEFSPDGMILALGDEQGPLRFFGNDGTSLFTIPLESPATLLRFNADASLLGAVLADGTLQVIHVSQGNLGPKIPLNQGTHQLIFSNDNQLVIGADAQGVTFYSLQSGKILHSIPVVAQDIALGPRQRMLAILHDGQVQLWGIKP